MNKKIDVQAVLSALSQLVATQAQLGGPVAIPAVEARVVATKARVKAPFLTVVDGVFQVSSKAAFIEAYNTPAGQPVPRVYASTGAEGKGRLLSAAALRHVMQALA